MKYRLHFNLLCVTSSKKGPIIYEKWEFFPFIKVLKNHDGHSYSFCWNFLEKHNGGGHIFFIPYGEKKAEYKLPEAEKEVKTQPLL